MDAEQQRLLTGAVAAISGLRPRIAIRTAGGAVMADPIADERKRRYAVAAAHPLVQEIVKRFQAELVGQEIIELEAWLSRLSGPSSPSGEADA
jgi:hypothetical protein